MSGAAISALRCSNISDLQQTPPLLIVAALRGACPACDAPTLFSGIVRFAPACPKCAADFERYNVGDGAASFLIFIIGAVILGLAMWVELRWAPPWWVHALLWGPLTLGMTLGLLRLAKSLLITLEYRQNAAQARSEAQEPQ